MRKVKKDNGWDEIKTKCIRFDGFSSKYFLPCISWKKFNAKKSGGQIKCQFCGKKWENQPDYYWTSLVQTTKGNRVLCEDCFDDFGLENTGMNKQQAREDYEKTKSNG